MHSFSRDNGDTAAVSIFFCWPFERCHHRPLRRKELLVDFYFFIKGQAAIFIFLSRAEGTMVTRSKVSHPPANFEGSVSRASNPRPTQGQQPPSGRGGTFHAGCADEPVRPRQEISGPL